MPRQTPDPPVPVIKVFGVGKFGGEAVEAMARRGLEGVELVDSSVWRPLESRTEPDTASAPETLTRSLEQADLVVIACGLGGQTDASAATMIAHLAREAGALVVAVAIMPPGFQQVGFATAATGAVALREKADAFVAVTLEAPTDREGTGVEVFQTGDDILYEVTRSITDLITQPGVINIDFQDLRSMLANSGEARFGIGVSSGVDRARRAAEHALSVAFRDSQVGQSTSALINIVGGADLRMREIQDAATVIQDHLSEDASIVFGASIDDTLGGNVRVSLLVAGFGAGGPSERRAASRTAAISIDTVPQSLDLFFDLASVDAEKAGRVIHALEKIFGTELMIVRARPLPPGRLGADSSDDEDGRSMDLE